MNGRGIAAAVAVLAASWAVPLSRAIQDFFQSRLEWHETGSIHASNEVRANVLILVCLAGSAGIGLAACWIAGGKPERAAAWAPAAASAIAGFLLLFEPVPVQALGFCATASFAAFAGHVAFRPRASASPR